MRILGIHDGHNSAACLLENGRVAYAAQEERFTYVKNQGGFPVRTVDRILAEYPLDSIDEVVFAGAYMGNFDWSREATVADYRASSSGRNIARQWLKQIPLVADLYRRRVNVTRSGHVHPALGGRAHKNVDHHHCHAASAYYGRGEHDRKILVITADGEGDFRSGSVYLGEAGRMQPLLSLPYRDSLGRIYSYMTYLYNMVPYEHEYKIMGLAPYCNDRKRIARCKEDLRQVLGFASDEALTWSYRGRYPSIQSAGRELQSIYAAHRFDVMSAGLQEYTEELLVEWVRRLVRHTGIADVALSGGVFMNVKANMMIAKDAGVRSVYVFPSCGDETNCFGAAFQTHQQLTGEPPQPLASLYVGDEVVTDAAALEPLRAKGYSVADHGELIEREVATLLARGEIVGRVGGAMEFGARSLGNRAILANPSDRHVLRTVNEMIKGRDFWMPFAPSVLRQDLGNYFHADAPVCDYEYMIFTAESRPEQREYAQCALHPYDFTGRPQAVDAQVNPRYAEMLSHYKSLTGESLVLNTSYNLPGYPMVRDQEQALDVFEKSGLQHLALDRHLISKPAAPGA